MNRWILIGALLTPLALAGCAHHTTVVYQGPPPAVDDFTQRGYHDGFDAARRDVREERPPDFRRHPNFRNPPVPPPAFQDYRRAFRSGYQAFLHNGPAPGPRGRGQEQAPPPPPPPQ